VVCFKVSSALMSCFSRELAVFIVKCHRRIDAYCVYLANISTDSEKSDFWKSQRYKFLNNHFFNLYC